MCGCHSKSRHLARNANNCMSKKILVADDDPAIGDALQLMLELEGYQVLTTTDGETVTKMESEFPDLLLLDIWMSGQDGREICKLLKKNKLTKAIPIILISASRDVQKSAQSAGADAFIAKPFEMSDLLKMVKKHVNVTAAS